MTFPADSYLVSSVLPEPNHSGYSTKDYVVVHDIECPPGPDWAESLGGPNYLQDPSEQHSVHYVVDSNSVIQGLPESLWAWGTGCPGSAHGIHIEQAGYASFNRDQWLGSSSVIGSEYTRPNRDIVTYTATDASSMSSQIDLLARLIADIHKRNGWTNIGWMSDSEVQSASQGNSTTNHMTTHLQITNSVGGTVHTDPGPNYPKDALVAKVQAYYGGATVPTPHTISAIPTPPVQNGFLMALSDADQTDLKKKVDWLYSQLQGGAGPGQPNVGRTIAAILNNVQNTYNQNNNIKGVITNLARALGGK